MKPPRSPWLIASAFVAGWSPEAEATPPEACVAPDPQIMAAVGDAGCSALLIGRDKILTAAHCADPRRFQLSAVKLSSGPYRERLTVTRCTQHPRFDGKTADFDLAVCQLEHEVVSVKPVELGAIEPATRQEPVCAVAFRGQPRARARRTLPGRISQLTSSRTARLDLKACAGDSGSPIFLMRSGGWQAFALLSGGEAASSTCSQFATATRLAPSLEWIRAQAQIP
jgi:secreted trypsin-like serine protease